MKKPLSIVLVGAGGMGSQWAEAAREAKGVSVQAVVDPDLARARKLAGTIPGCEALPDLFSVAGRSIDAAVIATPHRFLASLTREALRAGMHVLCEKPGGTNRAEVRKNLALAEKKGLRYAIGFNHRYHPAYLKAHELFEAKRIGKLQFIRARYGFGGRPGYGSEWRFKKELSGGGELLDQGMHMVDIARWFMGDPAEVRGFAENYFWGGEVEDNGFLLLRSKTGAVASIHVSWTNWDWVHSVEIYGSDGYLLINGLDRRYHGPERLVWGRRDRTFARPKEKEYVFPEERKHHSLVRELEAFLKGVREGSLASLPGGADAADAIAIIEQIYTHHGSR